MNVSACFSSCRAWRFMWSTNTSAVLKFYPAAGGKFYVFFKKSAFHRSDRKTQKRNPKRTIESKPVNDCLRNLAYNQNTAKLRSEYFLFESKGSWYSIGVKVPSTSSLSVYKKVLAHNLNDIRNWASLIGLLLRICWCLLSVFLIYCSDEWKKLVNLIYCFQVLFRMNFKSMYFLMKILGNTPSADSAASRDSLSSQNATWGIVFSPHFIDDVLNTRAECVRDSLICRKYMFLAKIFALRSMGIQLVPSPHLV